MTITAESKRPAGGRHRGTLALVLLVVLATLTTAYLNRERSHPTDDLHPQNPAPNGARAVAEVLAGAGVEVVVAADQDELLEAQVDSGTTLVVTAVEQLGESTTRVLMDQVSGAGTLVLTEPRHRFLDLAGLPVDALTTGPVKARAGCGDDLLAGLEVDVPFGTGFNSTGGSTGCFAVSGSDPPSSLLLRLDVVGTDSYLLGAPTALQNSEITTADHAALAVRLLGQGDRLVWYHATTDDLAVTDEGSAVDLLPRWLWPALLLGGLATLALIGWRGRRLGPLVVEPLPVTVRSVETAESRGRLYRKVGDREHAARALRAAARRRMTTRLGLSRGTPAPMLVHQLAHRTGRTEEELTALLLSGPVEHDTSLVRLVDDLARLESQLDPAADRPQPPPGE